MMRNILIAIFLISGSWAISQPIDFVYRDSILNTRSIQITSLNTVTSNSLNNAFLGKFVYGGAITDELLNDNVQKDFNVLGGEAEQTLSYFEGSFLKSHPNLGLTVSASDHNFASGSYKPDLFNLAFRGNSAYLGDTLDFSFAHGQYLHYQNYGIGVYDKRTQSYIRLGFLVGNRSIHFQSGATYFQTSESGDNMYFEADLSGHFTASDSASGYFSAQGYGFALELNHNFIVNTKSEKRHIVNFNLSNLGSIFWNGKTESLSIDSTYNYSGFDYDDIQNVSSLDQDALIDTLGVNFRTGSRRESLPIQIIINKVPFYSLTQKWQSTFGFKALLIPDYRPMLFGGVYFQPNKYFSISSRAIIGGYGGLRFGINANVWLKDNFFIGISTLDILGATSDNFGRGKSVNVALQLNF